MINRLPTELVRQIIETSVPSTYHHETYVDRQNLLQSLCLVCHLFRRIAQPLLREIVSFKDYRATTRLFELVKSKGWAGDICEVKIKISDRYYSRNVLLERLVVACPNLKLLDLWAIGTTEETILQIISRLTKLQTLRLYSNGLQLGRSSFPALLSLTVNASGDLETMQKLLDPLHFPSLRALAFNPISTSSFLDILSHPPCAPLFDQLDTFFIGVEALSPSLIIGHQLLLEKTLVSIGTALAPSWLSLALDIQNVGLCQSDFLPFAKLLREADDCKLRSLYLARPNPNDLISDPIFASEYDALLSACRDRKTEVIYEVQGELSDYIPVVSVEFWRRQRALRRSG